MSTDTSEHKNQPTWALHLALYAVLLAVIGFLVLRPGSGASAQEDPARNHVAARLDGVAIGYDEAIERAATQLDQLEQQRIQCDLQVASERHGLIERTLEGMVRERLIEASAAIAGLEAGDWRAAEMERLEAGVTDEDVDAFFVENEGRIRGEREELEPQVRTYLAQERFVDALEDGHEIEYLLEPYRLDVDPAAGPVRGAAAAPVTIVEWSDFECPYCKSVLPTLERILEEYPEQVRLVFRHFPLHAIHPNAQAAAEAGVCAQDLGAFWELHDLMFDEQDTLTVDDLKDKAERAGLDAEAFTTCLEREGIGDRVDADRRAGIEVGVNGTPALFVNGRPLAGAVAYEQLAEVVEDELERAGG
ncbi:MAG: thioredoxin domain-containing protein [Holophagales bacterium]|nr:thioredoxin domain-containing protein [Holophagales bacterium]MYF04432.1 thioredoxin domain-containing protein [Holophagales bacterium]MYJ26715.1 thioredoxin domain-containing protein [Holophagales bacterium]